VAGERRYPSLRAALTAEFPWYLVERTIAQGGHPSKAEIMEALRRQEPVPSNVQLYLAQLLAGEFDRRGRPKKVSEERKIWEAKYLLRRVERWERVFRIRMRVPDPRTRAYEKVAEERHWKDGGVTRRKYFDAKAILKDELIITTDAKLARLVGRK
jgi:hypothetical protein